MAKTQPRASLYFSDSLNEKIDAECQKTKLSKNRLLSKIIEEYFERKDEMRVCESIPEYCASKGDMQEVKNKIIELENKIKKLEK